MRDGGFELTAGSSTDWFIDPGTGEATMTAPALVAPTVGDFVLSARVEVDFASTFDAGALVLFSDERRWAKLAFEYSPDGEPMVVSVVTRGFSDDCNSTTAEDGPIYLRVARVGSAYAFHSSLDGQWWSFVRHFRLEEAELPEVGVEAQSPLGEGCTARFSEVRLLNESLADLRDGS